MRNPFRKQRKPMQDRPDHNPEEDLSGNMPGVEDIDKELHAAPSQPAANMATEVERLMVELDAKKTENDALHDKYVRLVAEFDNFRKRTAKERMDLLMSAGSDTIKSILPVLDDMERAIAHNTEVNDIDVVKQGFDLVSQKFSNILLAHGLKPMQPKGQPFDPELQEAITQIPAPTKDLKGKVVDVVETGYLLNDKVLRHAKVVVGA
jgi:molecular chaperone GrpE